MRNTSLQLLATDPRQSVLLRLRGVPTVAFMPFGYAPPNCRVVGYGGFHAEADGMLLLGNGYRGYSPTLLRFTRADALSPFGAGGVNCYGYCAGDPVNRHDPEGEFFKWLWPYVRSALGFDFPWRIPSIASRASVSLTRPLVLAPKSKHLELVSTSFRRSAR